MFGCSFFVPSRDSHAKVKNKVIEIRPWKFMVSPNHPQNLLTALPRGNYFSFRVFEQMENSFTDKRQRDRANAQRAAGPRWAL